jgi:hypothetical protein
MMNIIKPTQKSISSSWMPPPLSKIVPYVNSDSKHPGVLKVLFTSKGWVPSLPMPSGAHVSRMKKKMVKELLQKPVDMGVDSEEEVMKWPSGHSHVEDDLLLM